MAGTDRERMRSLPASLIAADPLELPREGKRHPYRPQGDDEENQQHADNLGESFLNRESMARQ